MLAELIITGKLTEVLIARDVTVGRLDAACDEVLRTGTKLDCTVTT